MKLPIIDNQVALTSDADDLSDVFLGGVRYENSATPKVRATTVSGQYKANGLSFDATGRVFYTDATGGLPAGTTFAGGLPFSPSGALCVSSGAVSTWGNGIPFAANGAVSALFTGGGPVPTLDISLLSTLDSRITFTRAGTRNYINNGELTALATGLPAFESWNSVNRGMAIEPGFTNLITYSNDPTNAVWDKSGISTPTLGDVGPGLINQFYTLTATADNSAHTILRTINGVSAGTTTTFSTFVKFSPGSTNYTARINLSNEYAGDPRFVFRLDGYEGATTIENSGFFTDTKTGYRKLSGGVYQIWITCTWLTTGNKQIFLGLNSQTVVSDFNFTAAVTDAVQVFGMQVSHTAGPAGYVPTVASTASQAAESAIFNDTAWLNTSVGTLVIDHDCWSGPLVGSGANTVLGASAPGSTAIAWSGVTSDTVANGGAASSGVQPTFSGSDVRLLSTSGASATGHIRRIRYYPTRLSVAELQTITAPYVTPTATPGVLRGAAIENRLTSSLHTTTGSDLYFSARCQFTVPSSPLASLRLDFNNIGGFAGAAQGNAISIESCALERETGVAEFVPVLFGGLRTAVVPAGANTTFLSDTILPSAFTGLSTFPAGTKFWVRLRGFVTSVGHTIPICRSPAEAGSTAKIHTAGTQYSPVDATGPMTFVSGTPVGDATQIYAPILVGTYVSGDPVSLFAVGDSLLEYNPANGNFVKIAARNLGMPMLEMSLGGTSQVEAAATVDAWLPYLKYSRVLVDEFGTNNINATLAFFRYWHPARHTYGCRLMRAGLLPRAQNSGDFSTEAVQTVFRAYPTLFPEAWALDQLKYGGIAYNFDPQSVRGVDKAKWLTNGSPGYMTTDGTHQTPAANLLIAAELQPILAAIVAP